VLHAAVRGSDFAARSGGEEFMILLASTSRDGAEIAAEKIRLAIAGIKVPQVERPITASLGVAVMPDHAVDGTALLRLADRALYEAKALGRDRVAIFDAGTTELSQPDPGELSTVGHQDGVAQ
jgi:diguanylate cyclase (GGDEF)-like protein